MLNRPCSSLCVPSLTHPSICRPDPALPDTLAPDPARLFDSHHLRAAPAVASHPDVHLVEPAAVAPVPLRVGGTEVLGGSSPDSCGLPGWRDNLNIVPWAFRCRACTPTECRRTSEAVHCRRGWGPGCFPRWHSTPLPSTRGRSWDFCPAHAQSSS